MVQLNSLFQRTDATETKILDMNVLIKNLKDSIPPSAESMSSDIKKLEASLNQYKSD